MDVLLAAFDLDERADRRFVDGDHDVLGRELLAVLLVAEPHAQPQLVQDGEQRVAVGDDGFVLFAHLHQAGLHRALEGQQALAALAAHAQHAAAPVEPIVGRIEQTVFLQPPAAQRRGADGEDALARLLGAVEPQLDLALERHRGG